MCHSHTQLGRLLCVFCFIAIYDRGASNSSMIYRFLHSGLSLDVCGCLTIMLAIIWWEDVSMERKAAEREQLNQTLDILCRLFFFLLFNVLLASNLAVVSTAKDKI